ncbi:hypothetical protein QVD17_28871 [Tagetes erecta]|uniref:Auxin response factor n=1 Tax=Tagetes erecta TaxID=13708 RepID=A0AAD8NSI0_TARER|nr:hypothetical protein QVD17_28871 [Tagetes erecta]
MINVMDSEKKLPMNEVEESLDSELWHACAGSMVQIPALNSRVLYFPQGHAEHAGEKKVDFGRNLVPACVLCQVSAVKFTADPDTDEVYAKIALVPLGTQNFFDCDDEGYDDVGVLGFGCKENKEKPLFFAKTLTQSDANNGGGFSVPRYCAETIFPKLDYAADPPVQVLCVKDLNRRVWKFRHIYRGTPRRHLLTTGWSNFVNHKKLVAGDSIVFFKSESGEINVGIRRAKRGIGCGFVETQIASSFHGSRLGPGNRKIESVIEAANLAASGQPFEVVYYPRASTPEFCVKASAVKAAMKIRWCPGMRFKMAFETEDSSRISWFMGSISSVQVEDQIHWPNSPWKLLQVTWDEPDLLQNVKRVNPWVVEPVASIPGIHLSPFSPPRKKLRFPQGPEFPLFMMPSGIQGARHTSQLGLEPYPHRPVEHDSTGQLPFQEREENISCLLTIGKDSCNQGLKRKKDAEKHVLVLFGQTIVIEPQLSDTGSNDTSGSVVLQNGPARGSSEEDGPCFETD